MLAVLYSLTFAVCVACYLIGDRPERLGALLVAMAQVVALAAQYVVHLSRRWAVVSSDALLAAGFLMLLYKHHRAWLLIEVWRSPAFCSPTQRFSTARR